LGGFIAIVGFGSPVVRDLGAFTTQLVGLFLFDAVLLLLPISLALAILRYRLWDIDLIINRALVYGGLTASVVLLYVLVVGYLGAVFRTGGNLVISLLATGLVAVMRQAVESARMGWGLCTVAGVAGKGETLDIIPRLLITGRRVCGSSFGGVKGRDQVPELVQLYLDGRLDVDPFISHRIELDEINTGFELMERHDGIRSVITFS
jgi:hypothetical protein